MPELTAAKNIRPYAVDVGGRMLAPGEGPVELDFEDPAVAEQVALGHVIACVLPPDTPTVPAIPAGPPIPAPVPASALVVVGEAGPELTVATPASTVPAEES